MVALQFPPLKHQDLHSHLEEGKIGSSITLEGNQFIWIVIIRWPEFAKKSVSHFLCFYHFQDLAVVHENEITNAVGDIYNYKMCKTADQVFSAAWMTMCEHKAAMRLYLSHILHSLCSPIQSVIETACQTSIDQITAASSSWSARNNKSIPDKRPSVDLSSAGCWYTNGLNGSNNDSSSKTVRRLIFTHPQQEKWNARKQKDSNLRSIMEFREKWDKRKVEWWWWERKK